MKKNVLIINPSFYPGYRSGGPQRTVENICNHYKHMANIFLLTINHDFGCNEEYELPANSWLNVQGIKVFYATERKFGYHIFRNMYDKFDVIYSCGLFCRNSYEMMLINRIIRKKGKKIYIAPMGVFSRGALMSKSFKKKIFLKVFDVLQCYHNIIWSFSSRQELQEARRAIGVRNINKYIIAEDLPRSFEFESKLRSISVSKRNELNAVFLSRISPKKNLWMCAQILNHKFAGKLKFDIYGIIEDEVYYDKCMKELKKAGLSVEVSYKGEVKPNDVTDIFSKYDVFLFPTKGENFGHVIYEALASGCLPVISDTTPWKDLEKERCGNVVEMGNVRKFRSVLDNYMSMDREQMKSLKKNAVKYAEKKYKLSTQKSGYNEVFL